VRALDEIAVGVGRQQRNVIEVLVGQVDAENVARLRLHHRPGRHAADRAVVGGAEPAVGAEVAVLDQLAGRMRLAVGAGRIGAQEHLVGGMRRVGLVLIDERRRRVLLLVDVVGGAEDAVGTGPHRGARLHHEAERRRQIVGRAEHTVGSGDERIVGLERNEDRAVAALGDEVEAVIEELAEEREPGIERRREARVRRHVRNEVDLPVVGGAEDAVQAGAGDELRARRLRRRRHRRRVVGRLVDDQIADGARGGVDDGAAGLRIGRPGLRRAEHRIGQAREDGVGGAKLALTEDKIVERSVDRAQAPRHLDVRQDVEQAFAGCIPLRDPDLGENELEVRANELNGHGRLPCRLSPDFRHFSVQ
jgi:hypothetical protein